MPTFILFLVFPLVWMWRSFVLMKVWGWFLLSVGAPRLGFLPAMGVMLIAALVAPSQREDKVLTAKEAATGGAIGFLFPLCLLLCGWLLHLFTA